MNFHMGDFVMSTWAFEKYNFTFLNIITCLIKKGFSIGKIWNSWWSIPNFLSLISFNCQIFLIGSNFYHLFIWHIRSFQLFLRYVCKIIIWIIIVFPLSFFHVKNGVTWIIATLRQNMISVCFERCLMSIPILSHSILNTCSMENV